MSRMNRTLIVSLFLLHVFVSGTRISQEKCAEYRRLFPAQYHEGEDAVPKEFPFMAQIENATHHYFIGILISEKYVLSVAHVDFSHPAIVLGDLEMGTNADDAKPKTYKVINTFIHTDFDRAYAFADIKLYQLNESIKFSEYVRPACLSQNDLSFTEDITLIGWGDTNIRDNNLLHKITLHYISNNCCKNAFNASGSPNYITNINTKKIFCAEPEKDNRRMITNTGHAVIQDDRSGPDEIIGLSVNNLGSNGANVTVFVRVSEYIDWIESVVWPGESTSTATQANGMATDIFTKIATPSANEKGTRALETKYIFLIIVAGLSILMLSASIAYCLLFKGKTRQSTVRLELNQNNNTSLRLEAMLQ